MKKRELLLAERKSFPSTLELKVGEAIFTVERKVLIPNLDRVIRPFLIDPGKYEVLTRVSPRVFEIFLEYVQKREVPVSESDYELLWLLAEEFGRSDLSYHFAHLLQKCQPDWEEPPNTYLGDGNRNPFAHLEGSGPRVTITVEGRSTTYELLKSRSEITVFGIDLKEAKEEDIVIDGIEGRDRLIEKAVEAVYSNAVANIPNCDTKIPFLVLTLWELGVSLNVWNIDAAIYCFNRLHKIAPTAFATARFLLLSQCVPGTSIPLPRAEWEVIINAIVMLRRDKNGEKKEANDLLREFHAVARLAPSSAPWD